MNNNDFLQVIEVHVDVQNLTIEENVGYMAILEPHHDLYLMKI